MALWQLTIDYRDSYFLYDNVVAVYNNLSGDTHLFVLLAHDVLLIIQQEALSVKEICQRLSQATGLECDEELNEYVESFLHDLVKFDLVVKIK